MGSRRGSGASPPGPSDRPGGPFRPEAPHSLSPDTGPLPPPQARPPSPVQVGGPSASAALGGGGGDFIAAARGFLPGPDRSGVRVPSLGAGRPGARWSCRRWSGAALSQAAGTISGRPFPGESHPPGAPGTRGPSSAGSWCAAVGADVCPELASPETWDLRSGPGASRWGVGSQPPAPCRVCSHSCLVGEGAVAGLAKTAGGVPGEGVWSIPGSNFPAMSSVLPRPGPDQNTGPGRSPLCGWGWTLPAVEAQLGSMAWGSHKEGWQEPIRPIWRGPDLWPVPALLAESPGELPSTCSTEELPACQVRAGWGGYKSSSGWLCACLETWLQVLNCRQCPTGCPALPSADASPQSRVGGPGCLWEEHSL